MVKVSSPHKTHKHSNMLSVNHHTLIQKMSHQTFYSSSSCIISSSSNSSRNSSSSSSSSSSSNTINSSLTIRIILKFHTSLSILSLFNQNNLQNTISGLSLKISNNTHKCQFKSIQLQKDPQVSSRHNQ